MSLVVVVVGLPFLVDSCERLVVNCFLVSVAKWLATADKRRLIGPPHPPAIAEGSA